MKPLRVAHRHLVFRRRVRVLADHLARLHPRGARVLDVGCGDGSVDRCLMQSRPDLRIHGIDVLIRPAAAIEVTPFDGRSLPFPDRAYDVVSLIDVLHHARNPEALLEEALRVAADRVIVKDHCRTGLLAGPLLRGMDWVGNAPHGVDLTYDYWKESRWRDCFARLGCEIASWQSRLGLYPWPASWLFDRRLHFIAVLRRAA